MSEKTYVINVKTRAGTIVTARGDTADELITNVNQLIAVGIEFAVETLEGLLGGRTTPPSVSSSDTGIDTVLAAVGGTVTGIVPAVLAPPTFNPVQPPAFNNPLAGSGMKQCIHGTMTKREGEGPYGHYKAFMCPTEKGTPDQCKAIYTKSGTAEYINF
jgi:predicted RNase H-like HicB family nuclease